jgi:hypothetical protein
MPSLSFLNDALVTTREALFATAVAVPLGGGRRIKGRRIAAVQQRQELASLNLCDNIHMNWGRAQ